MRMNGKRTLAILLIMALLITMIPPIGLTAYAATPRITIDHLYTSEVLPTDLDKVPRLTTPTISLSGSLQNVDEDQIGNLFYTVIHMDVNGREIERQKVDNNKATVPASNTYQFNNVRLFEGLNKIVVSYAGGSVQNSIPAWALYSAVPLISDLTIDDQPFNDGIIVPIQGGELTTIRGKGDNLQDLVVKNLATGQEVRARIDNNTNEFYVSAGTNRFNAYDVLSLQPGDNKILIKAIGQGNNLYQVERTFVYNRGSYAYDVKLQKGTKDYPLVEKPVIQYSEKSDLEMSLLAKLRVARENGMLKYPMVDVFLNGKKFDTYHLNEVNQSSFYVKQILPEKIPTNYTGSFVLEGSGFTGAKDLTLTIGTEVIDVTVLDDQLLVSKEFALTNSHGAILTATLKNKSGQVLSSFPIRVIDTTGKTIAYNVGGNEGSLVDTPVVLHYNNSDSATLNFGTTKVKPLHFRSIDGTAVNPGLSGEYTSYSLAMSDYERLQGLYTIEVEAGGDQTESYTFPLIFLTPSASNYSLQVGNKNTSMIVPGSGGVYTVSYGIQPWDRPKDKFLLKVLHTDGTPISPAIELGADSYPAGATSIKFTLGNNLDNLPVGNYQFVLTYAGHVLSQDEFKVDYPVVQRVTPNQLYLGYANPILGDDKAALITLHGENLDLMGNEVALNMNDLLKIQVGNRVEMVAPEIESVSPTEIQLYLKKDWIQNPSEEGWPVKVTFNGHVISQDGPEMKIVIGQPDVDFSSSSVTGDGPTLLQSNHYAYFFAKEGSSLYTDNLKWYITDGTKSVQVANTDDIAKITDSIIAVNIAKLFGTNTFADFTGSSIRVYFTYGDTGYRSNAEYMMTKGSAPTDPFIYSYDIRPLDTALFDNTNNGNAYHYYDGKDVTLTVYGKNLNSNIRAVINGIEKEPIYTSDSKEQLKFTLPANAVGQYAVKLIEKKADGDRDLYSLNYLVKYPPLDYERPLGLIQTYGQTTFTMNIPAKGVKLNKVVTEVDLSGKLQVHILGESKGTLYNLQRPFTSATLDATTNSVKLTAANVGGLAPGNYQLIITYGGDYSKDDVNTLQAHNVLPNNTLLPFQIVVPSVTGVDRDTVVQQNNESLHFSGSNLGSIKDDYSFFLVTNGKENLLKTSSDLVFNQTGDGMTADFDFSTVEIGAYQLRVKYKQQVVANFPFRVAGLNASLRYDPQGSGNGDYEAFNLQIDQFSLPNSVREQELKFVFYNQAGEREEQAYRFVVEQGSNVYIESVSVPNVGILSESNNLLTESPIKFEVKVRSSNNLPVNTKVNMYMDGDLTPNTQSVHSNGIFTFNLAKMEEGRHTITFVPVVNNLENQAGAVTYQINYQPSPYVIFTNLYNNQTFDKETIRGLSPIKGKLINISDKDLPYVKVTVNGVTDKLSNYVDTRKREFSIPVGLGSQKFQLTDGKNTITISIYLEENQATPISTTSVDFYYFETEVPDFLYIKPVDPNSPPRYTDGNKPDTYITSAKTVELEGEFTRATEIYLKVRRTDKDGRETILEDAYYDNFSKREKNTNRGLFTGKPSEDRNVKKYSFSTVKIDLSDTGSTFFEFTIRNGGLTTTKTIEIVRQPMVYEIVKPNLDFSHIVNTNILEVRMVAEGADQVIYNKKPAIKQLIEDKEGNPVQGFVFRTKELKANKDNKITFEVVRGAETLKGEFTVYFAEKAVPGAQYWSTFDRKITAFNKQIQMDVPKGTVLRRNDWKNDEFYLTPERQIVIAIAEDEDGRVDRERSMNRSGKLALQEPTGRFFPISPLYWIDAGTVDYDEEDADISIRGRGQLPYEGDYFFRRNPEDLMVPITNEKPVMLTLSYDENIRQEGWPYITVYHYDYITHPDGSVEWKWKNIGGVVDPKKHTIKVPIERFGFYQVRYMRISFDDVINHPWARDYLDTMYSKGYMNSRYEDEFAPNIDITRGEFATILVKAFQLPLNYDGKITFIDSVNMNNRLYDYRYIETAARAGIIRGGTSGYFYPDRPISREDAAVMIARAAQFKLDSIEKIKPKAQKAYTDANKISEYALPSVMAVVKAGYMEGKLQVGKQGAPDTYYFAPRESLTRAEAAAIAMRVLQGAKMIPKR